MDQKTIRKIVIAVILALIFFFVFVIFHKHKEKDLEKAVVTEAARHLRFAAGEFLVRVHDDHKEKLNKILDDHGLVLKVPLFAGWALVVEDQNRERMMIGADHPLADKTLNRLQRLHADDRIHAASFNYEISMADEGGFVDAADLINDEPKSLGRSFRGHLQINDPYFLRQWNLQAHDSARLGGTNSADAWSITRGKADVVVAVVEDGFFLDHPDLRGAAKCKTRFLPGFDFKKMNADIPTGLHGTHVLGVLAACSDNGIGITGVDWNSKILPIGRGKTTSDALISMLWGVGFNPCLEGIWKCPQTFPFPSQPHPADVMNMSFVVYPTKLSEVYQKFLVRDFWQEAISITAQKKAIVVASAGNESVQLTPLFHAPAGAEGVIAVGSVDRNGVSPKNSRFGPDVDILAPGIKIWSTTEGPAGYSENNGTSFAAPAVSGVVALMRSVYPDLSFKGARYFLQKSATRLSCDQYCGNKTNRGQCAEVCCDSRGQSHCPGLMNAAAAVRMSQACAQGREGICTRVKGQYLPNAPLLELDNYVLFVNSAALKKQLKISNYGAKKAWISIKSSDPEVVVTSSYLNGKNKFVLSGGESVDLTLSRKPTSSPPQDIVLTFEARGNDSWSSKERPPIDTVSTVVRYKR